MAEVRAKVQRSEVSPAADPRQAPSPPGVRKGFVGFLKSIFAALRARKRQVSAQPKQKSAQDWRDELRAKNPWWGNGL
jgi:hypothetical protein